MSAEKTIRVSVRLQNTSQPLEFVAQNTYEKGSFFCIYQTSGIVKKIPIATIFDIDEDYGSGT
jgi:hypothetical protein